MFSPRWKKDAKLLSKGARKFLQYKRDLLDQQRLLNLEEARENLNAAIRSSDREAVEEACKLCQ